MENNSLAIVTPLVIWSMAILGAFWVLVYNLVADKLNLSYLKARKWFIRIESILFFFLIAWYIVQLFIQRQ